MEKLPVYSRIDHLSPDSQRSWHHARRSRVLKTITLCCVVFVAYSQWRQLTTVQHASESRLSVPKLHADLAYCGKLQHKPQDPYGYRDRNARYLSGNATLIQNATVWTGEPLLGASAEDIRQGKGYGWIKSDVLLENGLIAKVAANIDETTLPKNCQIWQAGGRQLTAGIIDMHSHTGIYPLPSLWGGDDGNELSEDITPQMRSKDGIDPMDHQLQVIKSGGVTTSLILPGSGNNMGGEAYLIKHAVGRHDGRSEISVADMMADPDSTWRYMKMACGENAKRVYGKAGVNNGPYSRMGESFAFRHAFEQARELINKQDDWCRAASTSGIEMMKEYLPMDLKWESLAAALRGQVHINTHCYTVNDLEAFVDHTNEFNFSVRAFHHAHQTYLVPEILKRAWGERPPAAALFADNMYYKVESYTASEQAGKILYENGITPIYVSDNPVLNAQHVVFEAAKAYGYGLPYSVALAGVTTAPAELLGMGGRIGKVKASFDADVVVWDSDPLSVGAAPMQVWIDGTAQFPDATTLGKPLVEPLTPNSDLGKEIIEHAEIVTDLVFTGIAHVMLGSFEQPLDNPANVVVRNGHISCVGSCTVDFAEATDQKLRIIPLKNGYLTAPFTAFGSNLGLAEIDAEEATQNGKDTNESFSLAVDGLQLQGKHLDASYAHGVVNAISAPMFSGGGQYGLSTGFSLGATNAQEGGAVWNSGTALHYTLTLSAKQGKTPSISSAIGALRSKLMTAITSNATEDYSEAYYLQKVVHDSFPLVITVHSADTIAALLRVKSNVEQKLTNSKLRLVLLGAAESHLIAAEIAASNTSVVLAPLLAYSTTWDQRRSLTGAPLTNGTAIDALLDAGVLTAIGTTDGETWEVRNLGLMAGIAYKNGQGRLSEAMALRLVSSNFEEMLGMKVGSKDDFVVFEGSPLEIGGRVKAVSSLGRVSLY